MAFDKKKITDIDQAKTTKYGLTGKERVPNDSEKRDIFDPYASKGVIEIQDLAELFNQVIEAEQTTSFNQTLYDKLNQYKTDKKQAYEAINSSNGKYDLVLGNLFARKKKDSPTPDDEAKLKERIGQLQVS